MRKAAALTVGLALGLILPLAPGSPARAAPEAQAPQSLALEAVAIPIIVDGKLVNYVFCSIRLDLGPKADGAVLRAKEQYFRDDIVRAAHRTPFTRPDDYTRVDEAKIRAELLRYAAAAVGPGMVQQVVITKQTSQKLLGLPSGPQSRTHEIVP
jgi:hypothetical protein